MNRAPQFPGLKYRGYRQMFGWFMATTDVPDTTGLTLYMEGPAEIEGRLFGITHDLTHVLVYLNDRLTSDRLLVFLYYSPVTPTELLAEEGMP